MLSQQVNIKLTLRPPLFLRKKHGVFPWRRSSSSMASGRSTSRWTSASWVWPPRPALRAASGRGRCSWPWKQVESRGELGMFGKMGKKTGEKLLWDAELLSFWRDIPVAFVRTLAGQGSMAYISITLWVWSKIVSAPPLRLWVAAVVVLKDCLFTLWLTVPETYESWKLEVRQLWIDQSITKSARNQLWLWRFYSSKFHLATWLLQDFICVDTSFIVCFV